MKLLIFGKNGQLGRELQASLVSLGEVVALDAKDPDFCGDLTNLGGLSQTIKQIAPNVIINAAAYTAVDRAEIESVEAHLINAEAVGVMARCAREIGGRLLHYSTDYVFDGSGHMAWQETDAPGPLNVYGLTKLEGEAFIEASGCDHVILRTSWVYSVAGSNFIKTILRLANTRDELSIVDDQIGAPTGADYLAQLTAEIIRRDQRQKCGLYHAVASGQTSWFSYAQLVLETARSVGRTSKLAPGGLKPIKTKDFETAALRPLNSRLDTAKLQADFGLNPPAWETGVVAAVRKICQQEQGQAVQD